MLSAIRIVITQAALWCATSAVVVATLCCGYVFVAISRLPHLDAVAEYRPAVASRVLGDDGTVIGEFGTERRIVVPLSAVPPQLVRAFLAAEDADFYRHGGIDLSGLARAGVKNLLYMKKKEGGSTITQQVTRSLLLSQEKRYSRKIKEIILARRLERRLTKNEILYIYLNQIYLGAGAYGVEAASLTYFGKHVAELSLAESALLAALPKAPNNYSPLRNPGKALERRNYVLDRMVAEGFVTAAAAAMARQEPLALKGARHGADPAMGYPMELLRTQLEQLVGEGRLHRDGLTIQTTFSPAMQRAAWRAVRAGLEEIDRRGTYRGPLQPHGIAQRDETRVLEPGAVMTATVDGIGEREVMVNVGGRKATLAKSGHAWPVTVAATCSRPTDICPGSTIEVRVLETEPLRLGLTQTPEVQGALVSLDPASGDVKALIGGYDFRKSQFNRATQARRQAGSTFKPFIYAAALAEGFSPSAEFEDAPVELPDGRGGVWQPRNYDDDYRGPVTMREALNRSLNVVSVRIMSAVGAGEAAEYASRFGFATRPAADLSLALGTTPVTPLELASAYAVFAGQGQYKPPRWLLRVTDRDGRILYGAGAVSATQAIEPAVAAGMTGMLRGVVESGTGGRARALGRPVAGKTGTTNDARDAWFAGFVPQLATAVWVGYDQERSIGGWASGGAAALPIWVDFMKAALAGAPRREFVASAPSATGRDVVAAGGEEEQSP